ncbi:MAG: hypothetical protein IJ559_07775 [Prevotella sp.]|nr:hypothetical protein [Prevotella sp.]
MEKENLVWNKILNTVLKMPGVKVDRIGFLRRELRPYCNQSRLQMIGSVRPYTIVSEQIVDKLARQCVRRHTALATATSTVAGLPGGLAMAATLPADLTQYFFHIFVLSQKLAYLYGYPDLCDDEGELSDMATDLLTIFMGVVVGAPVAEKGLGELSKAVAESAVTRLPRVALTKTAIVPIAAQVAKIIGARLSKDSLAKGVGRFIPVAGGLFSGGLTLYTFRRGAHRLNRQLRAQRHLFDDGDIDAIELANIKTSFVKAGQAERDPEKVQEAMIEALINIAKINDEVSHEKFQLIEQRIARSKIDPQTKLALLGNIESDHSYEVDFDLLAADRDIARETFDAMQEIAAMGDKMTMAEKIYLQMAAQKLGIENNA